MDDLLRNQIRDTGLPIDFGPSAEEGKRRLVFQLDLAEFGDVYVDYIPEVLDALEQYAGMSNPPPATDDSTCRHDVAQRLADTIKVLLGVDLDLSDPDSFDAAIAGGLDRLTRS